MDKDLNAPEFKWVVKKLDQMVRWTDGTISVEVYMLNGTFGKGNEGKLKKILHYLRDVEKVIEIIEEPLEEDPDYDPSINPLSDDAKEDRTRRPYKIRILDNYDKIYKNILSKDRQAKLSMEGDAVFIDIDGHKLKVKSFNFESTPYMIIREVLSMPDTRRAWSSVEHRANASASDTPDEYIRRNLGIKPKSVQDKFFPVKTKSEITFVSSTIITPQEYIELANHLGA